MEAELRLIDSDRTSIDSDRSRKRRLNDLPFSARRLQLNEKRHDVSFRVRPESFAFDPSLNTPLRVLASLGYRAMCIVAPLVGSGNHDLC